jgi:ATP-binding cassette subfamily B multidrug efflux pump
MANQTSEKSGGDFRTRMVGQGPAQPGKIEKARNPRRALGRLVPYLGPYKTPLVVVLGFVLISTVLGLIGPYLMGKAFDGFIATKNASGLVVIAVWMLVIFLIGSLVDAISGWIMAGISQKALKGVRRDLFGHLQTLTLRFFDNHTAGELMSRLTNDIDAINQAVSQNVVALLASVLSLVGILIAMFVLNLWLALAAVVVVPIMFWFTDFVARYTRKGFRDLQKSLGNLNGVTEEAISGQRVVKAFRRNDSAIENFRLHNREVYRSAIYANAYAADKPIGQPVRHRHRRTRRLAGIKEFGDSRDHSHVHQLRAQFHQPIAPVGKYVQLHPGRAGWVGAGLRDH